MALAVLVLQLGLLASDSADMPVSHGFITPGLYHPPLHMHPGRHVCMCPKRFLKGHHSSVPSFVILTHTPNPMANHLQHIPCTTLLADVGVWVWQLVGHACPVSVGQCVSIWLWRVGTLDPYTSHTLRPTPLALPPNLHITHLDLDTS